jgi:hypothetical protein
MCKHQAVCDNFTYLGFNESIIRKLVEKDKLSQTLFKIGKNKIKLCSKIKHRMELLKLSSRIMDLYIVTMVKKLKIIIDIKTKSINEYWGICSKGCRFKGFGFCFCRI